MEVLLVVRDPRTGESVQIPAKVDTGFSGWLCLPPSLIENDFEIIPDTLDRLPTDAINRPIPGGAATVTARIHGITGWITQAPIFCPTDECAALIGEALIAEFNDSFVQINGTPIRPTRYRRPGAQRRNPRRRSMDPIEIPPVDMRDWSWMRVPFGAPRRMPR